MISGPWWAWVLMVIGLANVIAVVGIVVYLIPAWILALAERFVSWLQKKVFYTFGGEAENGGFDGNSPKPPWDRIWVELRYLSRAIRKVGSKLGYWSDISLVRPDLERLYELREENWSDE